MPWAVASSAISAGGNILGSVLGGGGASKAAKQAAMAQQQAIQFGKEVYGNTSANLQPYISTGKDALSSLAGFYGLPGGDAGGAQAAYNAYTQTPGYEFQYGQGLLGANRGLAAAGLTGSGAQAKALTQYGQGYASSNFNNYLSQLSSLAGLGQQSGSTLGQIGLGTSGQIGGYLTGIGNVQAAGTVGGTNAMNTGVSGALGAAGKLFDNKGVQGVLSGLFSGGGGSGLGGSSYNLFGGGGNAP